MRIFVGYLYTDQAGTVSPGLEIVHVTNPEVVKACSDHLYSGHRIDNNNPIFEEIVEDVPIGMRKDGIYIMEMFA